MNEAYRIRSKVHVSFILYSRKLSLDSNFTQPAKFAIAFAEIKINFLPCSRGRHRLYVVINTILTNSLWNKNFTHESWEQKWQNFSGKKYYTVSILYKQLCTQCHVHLHITLLPLETHNGRLSMSVPSPSLLSTSSTGQLLRENGGYTTPTYMCMYVHVRIIYTVQVRSKSQ